MGGMGGGVGGGGGGGIGNSVDSSMWMGQNAQHAQSVQSAQQYAQTQYAQTQNAQQNVDDLREALEASQRQLRSLYDVVRDRDRQWDRQCTALSDASEEQAERMADLQERLAEKEEQLSDGIKQIEVDRDASLMDQRQRNVGNACLNLMRRRRSADEGVKAQAIARWRIHASMKSRQEVEEVEQRHRMDLVLRRWTRRGLAAVMDEWCRFVANRALCRRVMNRILQRVLNAAQARAFVSFRDFVMRARDQERAREAAAKAGEAGRAGAVGEMQRCSDENAALRSELEEVRTELGQLRAESEQARAEVEMYSKAGDDDARDRVRRTMAKIMSGMMHGSLKVALHTWKKACDMDCHLDLEQSRLARCIAVRVARWTQTNTREAVRVWLEHTRAARATDTKRNAVKQTVARFMKRFDNRHLAKGWETWHAAIRLIDAKRSKVRSLLVGWERTVSDQGCAMQRRALRQWVEATRAMRAAEEGAVGGSSTVDRMLKRWSMKSVDRAFRTWWQTVAADKTREREGAMSVGGAMRAVKMMLADVDRRRTMRAWQVWARDVRGGTEDARKMAHASTVVTALLRTWNLRQIGRAVRTWRAACKDSVVEVTSRRLGLSMLHSVVARWHLKNVGRAFSTLRCQAKIRLHTKKQRDDAVAAMVRCLAHWRKRRMGRCLHTWQRQAVMAHELATATKAVGQLGSVMDARHGEEGASMIELPTDTHGVAMLHCHNAAAGSVFAVLAKWRQRAVARSFRQWCSVDAAVQVRKPAQQAHAAHRLFNVLRRRQDLFLRKAFSLWRQHGAAAEAMERMRKGGLFLLRATERAHYTAKKARALHQWSRGAHVVKADHESKQRGAAEEETAVLRQGLAAADGPEEIAARVAAAVALARGQHALDLIMGNGETRATTRAFRTWLGAHHEAQAAENEAKAHEMVVRRCVQRMTHAAVSGTFDRWHDFSQESKEMRHRVLQVVGRWRRKELCGCFERWGEMVEGRDLCRRVMNKILNRYLNAAQSHAFVSWRAIVLAAQEGDAEAARHDVVVRRCVHRMTQQLVARTLGRWSAVVKEKHAYRHKLQHALRRWQRQKLSHVYDLWTLLVQERDLCRRVMNKILNRYLNAAQSHAFVSWRAIVLAAQEGEDEDERHALVVARCVQRMARMAAARTFDRWHDQAQECKSHRHLVGQVIRRWQRRTLGSVVNRWCDMVAGRQCCRRVVRSLLRKYAHQGLARGLNAWKATAFPADGEGGEGGERGEGGDEDDGGEEGAAVVASDEQLRGRRVGLFVLQCFHLMERDQLKGKAKAMLRWRCLALAEELSDAKSLYENQTAQSRRAVRKVSALVELACTEHETTDRFLNRIQVLSYKHLCRRMMSQ